MITGKGGPGMEEARRMDGFTGERIVVLPAGFLAEVREHPLVRPVYFTDIGYFPHAQGHWRERPAGVRQDILIVCTAGEGFVQMNGRRNAVQSGDFIYIPRSVPHIYGADPVHPWTILWAHCLGANTALYRQKMAAEGHGTALSMERQLKIQSIFEEIFFCLDRGYTLDGMICVSQALAHLFGVLFYMDPGAGPRPKRDRLVVGESIQFMKDNLGARHSLRQLARQAALSPAHYSALFKKNTGIPPVDYLNRLRIQEACHRLDTTDRKVSDIARELGFQDPYYFSRAFRKVMQQSPAQYRRLAKG